MNIKKINSRLASEYDGRVQAELNELNNSIVLSGELDTWEDIIEACSSCVYDKDGWHVVNHIRLAGVEMPTMHMPQLEDDALEGAQPDVLIIGGGICGAAIARELTKWKLDILLVDKESDLAAQASSRNDGEVHPGVDQKKLNLKLYYELRGNAMYPDICRELGVKFKRNGQYVAFKGKSIRPILETMAHQRRSIGVTDTKIIGAKELYQAQPNLNEGYDIGLYNSRAGTVCPYGLTIAYAENAVQNGAKVSLNTVVLGMELEELPDAEISMEHIAAQQDFFGVESSPFIATKQITAVKTNRGTIYPKLVINAAGIFSDKLAAMAGDEFFSLHPRRGTEVILDNKKGYLTDSIVSYRDLIVKGEKNTKGGGILHTVDHNILVGPDAVETYERENYATNPESIEWLCNKQKKTIEAIDKKDIITYFTGVRAASFEEDFIVERGRTTSNILHCAGIQSPGLTAAPALALDISEMAVSMLEGVVRNKSYNPVRKAIPCVKELDEAEREALIKKNPDYGIIICRCEEISKGEILDALNSPICVPTLDGIKRRVRPGMGRCQGGFCGPQITSIIAEFTGSELSDVSKNGNNSKITLGKTK